MKRIMVPALVALCIVFPSMAGAAPNPDPQAQILLEETQAWDAKIIDYRKVTMRSPGGEMLQINPTLLDALQEGNNRLKTYRDAAAMHRLSAADREEIEKIRIDMLQWSLTAGQAVKASEEQKIRPGFSEAVGWMKMHPVIFMGFLLSFLLLTYKIFRP